jgi:hypothetical protein
MTQVMAGMITHAGISLAEVSSRRRKAVSRDLYTAIRQILLGLGRSKPGARKATASASVARD